MLSMNKLKNVIKSFFKKEDKWEFHTQIDENSLRQKRICDKWSIQMLAEFYLLDEISMREVLDFYSIR